MTGNTPSADDQDLPAAWVTVARTDPSQEVGQPALIKLDQRATSLKVRYGGEWAGPADLTLSNLGRAPDFARVLNAFASRYLGYRAFWG